MNHDKKQQAQLLYITQGKSHAQIAAEVGVSERTVFSWVHQYAWNKLRLAAYQAPVTIADNLCAQVVEMQNAIAARQEGQRFPTAAEAATQQKLLASLDKVKKYPSLSQSMQVLETFRNYVRPRNKDLATSISMAAQGFLEAEAVNGYKPYQVEYGTGARPPLAPYYEEPEAAPPAPQPCAGFRACRHTGNCSFPECTHAAPRFAGPGAYAIPGINYAAPFLAAFPGMWQQNTTDVNPAAGASCCGASGNDPEIPQPQTSVIIEVTQPGEISAGGSANPAISGNDPEIPQPQTSVIIEVTQPGETTAGGSAGPAISGNDPEIPQPQTSVIIEVTQPGETHAGGSADPAISGNDPEIPVTPSDGSNAGSTPVTTPPEPAPQPVYKRYFAMRQMSLKPPRRRP